MTEMSKMVDAFLTRDKNAVDDFNSSWAPKGIEARLAFAEGRLTDLCALVIAIGRKVAAQERPGEERKT